MSAKYTVDQHADDILDILEPWLDLAELDLDAEVTPGEEIHPDFDTPDLMVRFTGEDVDLLLANKGELLLALELLTMEALRIPPEDHARLCFDANEFRVLRMRELMLSAQTAAEMVKSSGRPFFFSPMSSRERRIIHIALREEKTLRSESVGNGPFRQVCVLPVDMPLPPAPPPPRRPPGGPGGGGRPDRDGGRGGRDGGRDRGRGRGRGGDSRGGRRRP